MTDKLMTVEDAIKRLKEFDPKRRIRVISPYIRGEVTIKAIEEKIVRRVDGLDMQDSSVLLITE